MTEAGEHHAHHTKKDSDFTQYILPLSILLAAVIVGYSMVSAAAAIGAGLSGVTINGGTGTTGTLVPDQGGPPELGPPLDITIADLSGDVAGKLGDDSAGIIVVEYSDFQCPFCRRHYNETHPTFQQWVGEGTIQLWFKDFPLTSIHPVAAISGEAARCASEQDMFWEMHDKIFDAQGALNPTGTVSYTPDDLKTWAGELGLDSAEFDACLDSGKYTSAVSANLSEGQTLGINGTPSFAIGLADSSQNVGVIIGACPVSAFETAIAATQEGKQWSQITGTCTINVAQ